MIFRKKRELIEEGDDEIKIISDNDIDRLMIAAKNTKYYIFFCVLQYTGLRPSEVVGLKIEDENLLYCRSEDQ